jgi:hypothetical protein
LERRRAALGVQDGRALFRGFGNACFVFCNPALGVLDFLPNLFNLIPADLLQFLQCVTFRAGQKMAVV